ncbi:MAG: hypothetical protein K5872_01555 [Rhizobiaceae bacterium]|nr:hypothetical protein [Rhizobiaceae bacterium]MCV0404893.1 hypothetical protein [Rhizobiaceae bacterium]
MTGNLDTTGRCLFELRFEQIAPGRAVSELVEWYRKAMSDGGEPSLWSRHSIPTPLEMSCVVIGPHSIITLYRWNSLTERESSFGRLLESGDAPAIVPGAEGSLLREAESWILAGAPAGEALVEAGAPNATDKLQELRIQQVLNGSSTEAAETLTRHELSMAIERGARIRGVYELAIGPERPLLISFLSWNAKTPPERAWAEIDAAQADQRDAERQKHQRRLVGISRRYLMRPLRNGGFEGAVG